MDPLHVRHMDIYAYLLMREKKTVELQRFVCHALVSITFDIFFFFVALCPSQQLWSWGDGQFT